MSSAAELRALEAIVDRLGRPLGGRMGASSGFGNQANVVGTVGDPATLASWPDAGAYIAHDERWNTNACDGGPGLWRCATTARGAVLATSRNPRPLTVDELISFNAPPAGTARTFRAAPIWAHVTVQRTSVRRYLIDWGQTIMVHAEQVGVGWFGPPSFAEVNYAEELEFTEQDVVVQSLLGVESARVEGSDTSRRYTLTQTYYVPETTVRTVPVPAGAVALQISRDHDGATLTTWARAVFGLAGTTLVRRTTSIRIENAQSVLTSIAPHVTHIELPELPGEEALWSLAWEIEF